MVNEFTIKEQVVNESITLLLQSCFQIPLRVAIDYFTKLLMTLQSGKANQKVFGVTKCSSPNFKQNESPHICLIFDALNIYVNR